MRVSVVVATRNRPELLRTCLASVLASSSPADEILVIDQSTDDRTAGLIAEQNRPGRLRYLRQNGRGLSRARNLALTESTGDILAFTDDDCEVAPDWVAAIGEVFRRVAGLGVIFGRVEPAPHDERRGLVPHCGGASELVMRTPVDLWRLGGMGACMAARLEVLRSLGGFDEKLGAGAVFPSAEETDLAVRAVQRGLAVVETPSVRVIHHGFRTWNELSALADGYLFGTGAMFAKHVRLWPGRTSLLLLGALGRWTVGRPRIQYSRQPRRLARLLAFARGWRRGMATPVDGRKGLFRAG